MSTTINDIKGEKRIDLSYSIDSDKEIVVIIMLCTFNINYYNFVQSWIQTVKS